MCISCFNYISFYFMEKLNLPITLFCFIPIDTSINRVIISRAKCGSRFLRDCGAFTQVPFNSSTLEQLKNVEKVYWVIREPRKHFFSALITELHSKWFSAENLHISSKKIKIKVNNEKLIFEVLEKLLQNVINNTGFSHYYPIYQDLLELIQVKYDSFYKVTFIELNDLSTIVNDIFKTEYPYSMDNYSFKFNETDGIAINTTNISEILETPDFLPYWNEIKPKIIIDANAYNTLSKFDFSKFLLEKIDELHDKLEINEMKHNMQYVDIIKKLNRILKINDLK